MVHRSPGLGVLTGPTRLAVWGDPIAHSRSPQLHTAAYAVLGLDWDYGRRQVTVPDFDAVLGSLDDSWRGLSVTFPLKSAAFAVSVDRDRRAHLTGAVNTLLLTPDGPHGFNTDVGGLIRMLQDHGTGAVERARIIGAGATATSALVALAELGARRVEVVARRPEATVGLVALGGRIGVDVHAIPFPDSRLEPVTLTLATIPGDAVIPDGSVDLLAESGGGLFDAVYGTWPTPLARAWAARGLPAHSGLGMLLHQAVLQVRIFVSGDADRPLPNEPLVLEAMRATLVAD
ncbi:shikimate dehydrogenase [Microbacterium rhizomatis]|uniref:Shikimate dehydrogenase n=1 Tax=Microbacterium rhizomatis TaxID=1631477 RepID=A0A5J5J6F3_9MICO|nr:shikimate dehydrogenase [Microbacterium rhizomatis]KAA9111611.1 shikimate dehydrogenase [Microbacterium rhizomatis]